MPRRLIGDFVLLLVTLSWGITFPLIENAVKEVHPAVFVTTRFSLATIILLPFIFSQLIGGSNKKILKTGFILGLLNTTSYLTQTIGMQTATAAQGAFITGIGVVIVPFLLPFFNLGKPTLIDIISSCFCLAGLFLLTGADFSHLNSGELWILLTAISYALFIVYLQKVSPEIKNLTLLAFLQIIFTTLFASVFSFHQSYAHIFNLYALEGLLFCAIFATSIAIPLQTKFQHYTTANRAAMIFCLEPVFASLFGYAINGETLKPIAMIGGFLIILSIILSEIYRVSLSKFTKEILPQQL